MMLWVPKQSKDAYRHRRRSLLSVFFMKLGKIPAGGGIPAMPRTKTFTLVR